MQQENQIRARLEKLLSAEVLPIAKKYGYESLSLSMQANWKPIVLIIGNYSSGKSTLINELVGGSIQRTGQAPTDDCFTVLTAPDNDSATGPAGVVSELTGQTVVNDPSFPFTSFKEFGSRFISHFLMKKVNSPVLKNLAIIDSPGMLDSVTEQDRGYDYQRVIGRLSELADLVVLVFDPHRAGTIKETYVSIRSTLPAATSEDRVLFVMNRIDECKNVSDLIRCFGVMCWNLSQMTGRKDIPRIFLTYSPALSQGNDTFKELADERAELIKKIEQAPRLQVSHLLGSADNHVHRLEMMTKTLTKVVGEYHRRLFSGVQMAAIATLVGAILGDSLLALLAGNFARSTVGRLLSGSFFDWPLLIFVGFVALFAVGFVQYARRIWLPTQKAEITDQLDSFANLPTQYAKDLWDGVRPRVLELLSLPTTWGFFAGHHQYARRLEKVANEQMKSLYLDHLQQGSAQVPST